MDHDRLKTMHLQSVHGLPSEPPDKCVVHRRGPKRLESLVSSAREPWVAWVEWVGDRCNLQSLLQYALNVNVVRTHGTHALMVPIRCMQCLHLAVPMSWPRKPRGPPITKKEKKAQDGKSKSLVSYCQHAGEEKKEDSKEVGSAKATTSEIRV